MGRRDAVQFTLEWAAEARRLGAEVTFEPGWETRGNGMSANYEGLELHHTAFLSSEGNPFPAKNTLKTGRTGLPGPLCNVAGPWCPDGAPRLHVMAAHPSNNAGASGGYNTAPLPVTSLFNALVFALEIDYGGVVPMSKGQRKAATIFGRAGINVLGKSTAWVKAHAETSVTGKWDPGYANGKTIDMGEFRSGITNFSDQPAEDDFMSAEAEARLNELANHVTYNLTPAIARLDQHAAVDYPFTLYQDTDPTSDHRTLVVLAAPGVWLPIPTATPEADYVMVLRWLRLAGNVVEVPMRGWWAYCEQMWMLKGATLNVDAAEIAAKLEQIVGGLTDADFQAIAKAAADEADRRARDGDPATGPVS